MMTLKEAAARWGVSYTVVRKLIAQGRVRAQRFGRTILVIDEDRPEPAHPGELSATARDRWNYGKSYRPAGKAGGSGESG